AARRAGAESARGRAGGSAFPAIMGSWDPPRKRSAALSWHSALAGTPRIALARVVPFPSLLCFVFAAGIAIALAGRTEIRVSPRPVLLTTSANALVIYASLLVVPVGVYFYVLHGDWFMLYLVDVERIPSALALLGFIALVGVGVLGFACSAALAR